MILWAHDESTETCSQGFSGSPGGCSAARTRVVWRRERACNGSDRQEISEADFDLHRTIIKLAEHGRLLTHYELIAQQTRLYIHSSNSLIAEPKMILAQHVPIVDAILAGDALQAAALSETHNVQEGEKLVRHLRMKEEECA
jgi:DNA-binding GntR family transcriptional regulator